MTLSVRIFLSAVDVPYSFGITIAQAKEFIKQYRRLSPIQREAISKALLESSKETLQVGKGAKKTEKRDFHNWKNKVQQIFTLLHETPYFEVRGELVVLGTKADFPELQVKLNRSLNEKYLYFKKHEVEKKEGFELHHIVPLSWSESIHHFKLLDKWENMLYIDGYSHAKITQNRNRNIFLTACEENLLLSDRSKNEVPLLKDKNVIYSLKKQPILLEYNELLVKSKNA